MCPACDKFFAHYSCGAYLGECDCPRCQGYCNCDEEGETP